jgi:hypothetical protein
LALVLKYSKLSESSTQLVLPDDTGNYSAENLGGYGSPNPVRNTLNLGVIAALKSSDGNVPLAVERSSPSSATVLNVTEWTIALQGGGYHKIGMFTAPSYDELAIYSQYDIVYVLNADKFYYYSNTESSLAGAFDVINGWLELNDPDILERTTQTAEEDGVNVTIVNDFLTYGLKVCFGIKSEDYVEAAHCKDCLTGALKENFKILMYRVYSESLAAAGNYTKGQIVLEKAEEFCGESNSSCGC